nr:unnamed protein product [Digitaria exilis]
MAVSPAVPRPSTRSAISPATSSRPRSICSTARASFIRPLLTSQRGDSGRYKTRRESSDSMPSIRRQSGCGASVMAKTMQ